jgi:aminodeoxychorismate synthase component I
VVLAARDGALCLASSSGPSPAAVLAHATPEDRPFALISGRGDPALSGWSYAGLEPIDEVGSLAEACAAVMGLECEGPAPFSGGAVGYVGYDLGWAHQARPRVPRPDPLGMRPARFLIYDAIYARNERTGEGYVLGQPGSERRCRRLAEATGARAKAPEGGLEGELAFGVDPELHRARILRVKERIERGEVYQVNLAHPLLGEYRGSPIAAFLRLMASPPPFAAYLGLGEGGAIVSASPECFFDLDARRGVLRTYPIKGTRPRSADRGNDLRSMRELAEDEKERAEHLMIVDLLRNDVGRVAQVGGVSVEGLAYVESFPTVHHLTSCVAGRAPGADPQAVMKALFPGGSITGAPKLRAMEIIDELEGEARGVYTGAIGYLTAGGSMRASIAIRTAQIADRRLRFGVGGGIVADSDPDREWEETMLKARALERALRTP